MTQEQLERAYNLRNAKYRMRRLDLNLQDESADELIRLVAAEDENYAKGIVEKVRKEVIDFFDTYQKNVDKEIASL